MYVLRFKTLVDLHNLKLNLTKRQSNPELPRQAKSQALESSKRPIPQVLQSWALHGTMNCDADASRFVAVVNPSGHRTEVITPNSMQNMFSHLINNWKPNHGGPPAHIMYFRDDHAQQHAKHV